VVVQPLKQSEVVKVPSKVVNDNSEISSAVYDSIALGLYFSHGAIFSSNVRKRFGSTVHPLGSSDHFYMVVSFGRAKFKLSEDSVGIAWKHQLEAFVMILWLPNSLAGYFNF
jgi:hypothetical protein